MSLTTCNIEVGRTCATISHGWCRTRRFWYCRRIGGWGQYRTLGDNQICPGRTAHRFTRPRNCNCLNLQLKIQWGKCWKKSLPDNSGVLWFHHCSKHSTFFFDSTPYLFLCSNLKSSHSEPITQDVVNDLKDSLSLNEDSLTNERACKYSLTPSFAVFIDALARESLDRHHYRIRKRLNHVMKQLNAIKTTSKTATRTSAGCVTACVVWPNPCSPSTWPSYCKTITIKTLHQDTINMAN